MEKQNNIIENNIIENNIIENDKVVDMKKLQLLINTDIKKILMFDNQPLSIVSRDLQLKTTKINSKKSKINKGDIKLFIKYCFSSNIVKNSVNKNVKFISSMVDKIFNEYHKYNNFALFIDTTINSEHFTFNRDSKSSIFHLLIVLYYIYRSKTMINHFIAGWSYCSSLDTSNLFKIVPFLLENNVFNEKNIEFISLFFIFLDTELTLDNNQIYSYFSNILDKSIIKIDGSQGLVNFNRMVIDFFIKISSCHYNKKTNNNYISYCKVRKMCDYFYKFYMDPCEKLNNYYIMRNSSYMKIEHNVIKFIREESDILLNAFYFILFIDMNCNIESYQKENKMYIINILYEQNKEYLTALMNIISKFFSFFESLKYNKIDKDFSKIISKFLSFFNSNNVKYGNIKKECSQMKKQLEIIINNLILTFNIKISKALELFDNKKNTNNITLNYRYDCENIKKKILSSIDKSYDYQIKSLENNINELYYKYKLNGNTIDIKNEDKEYVIEKLETILNKQMRLDNDIQGGENIFSKFQEFKNDKKLKEKELKESIAYIHSAIQ